MLPPMQRTDPRTDEATSGSVLVAGLTLRFSGRRLGGRVYWPREEAGTAGSPLIFVPRVGEAETSHLLSCLLCSVAGGVVLAIPSPRATGNDYELAALGWAVEHAAELGARPEQAMVAGEGDGAAHAARLAIRARDDGWPQLRRQVLVFPTFTQTCPMPFLLRGVAPATVISSDTRIDDGITYAARLRASEIEVHLLRHSPPILPGHDYFSIGLGGRAV